MDLHISGEEAAVRKVLEFVKPFIGNEIDTVSMGESMFDVESGELEENPIVKEAFDEYDKAEDKQEDPVEKPGLASLLHNLDPEMISSLIGAAAPLIKNAMDKQTKKTKKKG